MCTVLFIYLFYFLDILVPPFENEITVPRKRHYTPDPELPI